MNELRDKTPKVARSEIIKVLSERDGYWCYICDLDFDDVNEKGIPNRDILTIDHFIPLARGGTWELSNLRLACQPCNNLKGDIMPNPDGTVNFTKRKISTPKVPRPTICNDCESGRLLLEGETCPSCDSGPQPREFPRYRQRKPKNCDHSTYHCWMCTIGFIQRKQVIENLLTGDS